MKTTTVTLSGCLFFFEIKCRIRDWINRNRPFQSITQKGVLIPFDQLINHQFTHFTVLFLSVHLFDHSAYHRQIVVLAVNMSWFTSKPANNPEKSSEKKALAIDLNLQSPSTSQLATWVNNSNEKDIRNDFKYFALNDEKTRAFNRKAISLPTQARQDLYKLAPWKVGLHDDDLHVSLGDLQLQQGTKRYSVTEAHEPIKNIKEILKTYREFYVFPPNDKREPPPNYLSSKVWSKAIKNAIIELKKEDDEKIYSGWITMESWERHTKAKNHLLFAAGPLIDLKPWVDKVVVHHGARPHIPTRAFSLKEGYIPQRPYVSIHINSTKKLEDPIQYEDYNDHGQDLPRALNAIQVQKSIASVEVTLRIDIHKEVLFKYYNERHIIDVSNGKNPSPVTEKTLTDVRGFQKFLNRTFEPGQDDISLNSRDAFYQLGGGVILRGAHERTMRFEWTLAAQRGERLLKKILEHELAKSGYLFAIRVADLEGGNLYQLHASRDTLAAHPEMDALEVWSTLNKNPYAKPPYMYTKGSTIRSLKSVLTNLDLGGFPCDGGRNPIQSFAWSLFHNEGFVLFYGPDASLVRFWGPTGSTEPKDTAPRLNPIVHSAWAQPPDQLSFEIRTPSSERALHAQVVAGLLGPFKNWRKAADPNYEGNVYRAEYLREESAILAHQFCMGATSIVSAYPNDIKKNSLLETEDTSLSLHNKVVMAGTKLGSQSFVSALIEEDERLAAPPVIGEDKIQFLSEVTATTDTDALSGALVHPGIIDNEQEADLVKAIETLEAWDTSTRRKLKHFGFSHDHKGGNVQPTDPIPAFLETARNLAQQFLKENDIEEPINQCSIADCPPGVGVGEHFENFMLGKVVVTLHLLSTVPMILTPKEKGQPTTILLERLSMTALTGVSRFGYKHGIPSNTHDVINGETILRGRRIAVVFRSVPDVFHDAAE